MNYVYTKTPVSLERLIQEIEQSSITVALDIPGTSAFGDQLTVAFKAELSQSEEETLDDLVANHTGESLDPIPSVVNIENTVAVIPSNTYGMQLNSVSGECSAGSSVSIDFKLENYTDYPNAGQSESYTYKYLWGGWSKVANSEYGDYASFCIIDKDNILGYGENFVVKYYIKKAWILPEEYQQYASSAPGEIPLGLYLRCTYTAVNTGSTRNIYLTYDIETKE